MTRHSLRSFVLCVTAALAATACTGKDGKSCTVAAGPDGGATISCEDGTFVTVPEAANGQPGTSCTVSDQGDGTRLIRCTDGSSVTVPNGANGTSCTVQSNDAGVKLITCEDGTTATILDGRNGASCTVVDNNDGSKTLRCEDGTVVTVRDGESAASAAVADHHGEDFVLSSTGVATGQYPAEAIITGASASAAGVVTVDFRVSRPGGAPVVDVPSVRATIARLGSIDFAPPMSGPQFTRWVPYVYRTETVSGAIYPNPPGTTATQAWQDDSGTLVNHQDGSYTYTFATNVANVSVGGAPVPYERSRKHRVAIIVGGATGATASATLDFVPDGSADTRSRDVVRTTACQQCHGVNFTVHDGLRLAMDTCVTCHVPGTHDAHSGQSLDLRVLLHKVHAGGELPSVAGPDANPWMTADNGEYALWGSGDQKHDWRTVGFPTKVSNCTKCHDGAGADDSAWKESSSIAACSSCHDDVDLASAGTTHAGGQRLNDNDCSVCHLGAGALSPVDVAHDRSTNDASSPRFDARNHPEFTFDVTMSPPANGVYYEGNEAPVVSVVIKRNGTPIPDHRIQAGSAQGCQHTISAVLCDPDSDGRFANAALFVSGPRASAKPVLTTAARAQLLSTGVGPFDLSAAGAELVVKVDQGAPLVLPDAWATRVPGLITVPVSSGAWPAGTAAATADQIVTWLNSNSIFRQRAVAWLENGRVALRSRNLGRVYGLQLQTSAVTTAVFGGDTSLKMPSGSTAANPLTSTTDPKVTRYFDHIEYALDPVSDLAAGTYVVHLEVSQLGRVSSTDYVTPSTHRLQFNVKTSVEEAPIAGNCASCHLSAGGGEFPGFGLDPSRHNMSFGPNAVDQCIACHDYQPQSASDASGNGAWTGARPLSRRVHAIHYGSNLGSPLRTVDAPQGDPVAGRDWNITFPRTVLECEVCHGAGTSGTWRSRANRLACSGCHDGESVWLHMKLNTDDPTPADPWSGDEGEACVTCH